MTMQRWDPFRELRRMEQRMSRLWPLAWAEEGEQQWYVPMDVIEKPEKIVVKASLPGFDAGDIKVSFENGLLTLRGEMEEEREKEEGQYLLRERQYGTMFRAVRLPESVDPDQAETEFDNGVLTITFPKAGSEVAARPTGLPGQAEHVLVMPGDGLQLRCVGRVERPAVVPGVLDGGDDPEGAFRVADNPVLRTGLIHVDGYHAILRCEHWVFLPNAVIQAA